MLFYVREGAKSLAHRNYFFDMLLSLLVTNSILYIHILSVLRVYHGEWLQSGWLLEVRGSSPSWSFLRALPAPVGGLWLLMTGTSFV